MSPAGICSEWERSTRGPGAQTSLCLTWKMEGLRHSHLHLSWLGQGGVQGGGGPRAGCSLGDHPPPTQPCPEAPGLLHPHPPPQTDFRAPSLWRSLWPRARAPVPRGGGSCCPVYWALTIELCGLEHPAVCLRPTPAPARASLHPHPESGSSPGPAKEALWTGTGACHTHKARGWLCASGTREARVMAAGPAPAAPARPPATRHLHQ